MASGRIGGRELSKPSQRRANRARARLTTRAARDRPDAAPAAAPRARRRANNARGARCVSMGRGAPRERRRARAKNSSGCVDGRNRYRPPSRWYHVTYGRKAQGTRGRAPCTNAGRRCFGGRRGCDFAARVLMAFSNASGETRPAHPDPWIRQQPRSARARARVAQSFSGAEQRPSFRMGPSSNEVRRGGTRAAHRRGHLLSLAGI